MEKTCFRGVVFFFACLSVFLQCFGVWVLCVFVFVLVLGEFRFWWWSFWWMLISAVCDPFGPDAGGPAGMAQGAPVPGSDKIPQVWKKLASWDKRAGWRAASSSPAPACLPRSKLRTSNKLGE